MGPSGPELVCDCLAKTPPPCSLRTGRSNCRSCIRWASPSATGRQAISELQASLAGLYLDFAFKPEDTHVLIDTPEQAFAEYMAHPMAAATGRTAQHLFTGRLVAENGQIKLLRESSPESAPWRAQRKRPATRGLSKASSVVGVNRGDFTLCADEPTFDRVAVTGRLFASDRPVADRWLDKKQPSDADINVSRTAIHRNIGVSTIND